ncbi:MAG TPA: hypothetical protein DIC35_05295 [Candidatus Moranbacteria bacterium]|nr:hypothetical protein [Candidatus Moranbacteria bacterium]
MYWLFLAIFILVIMIPDIIRQGMFGMPQERVEEFFIFLLGMAGFLFFILKEHQLEIQRIEKIKEQRRLQQTSKDLVDSYSYIGEVNRKMDMLMRIGSDLSEGANMRNKKKSEVFDSIIEAALFLLKGEGASLIFYNVDQKRVVNEICSDRKCRLIKKKSDFFNMGENIYVKTIDNFMVFSSNRSIHGIRSYLVVKNFDEFQGQDNNNQEILKYLTVQALFLYSNFIDIIKGKTTKKS